MTSVKITRSSTATPAHGASKALGRAVFLAIAAACFVFLYYRLNGITLELPALAARRDKETLIRECLAGEIAAGSWASIEAASLDRLAAYNWPGNVRELRNTLQRHRWQ